jgi:hypothetical protein
MKIPLRLLGAALVALAWPALAGAQAFETVGTRAAGMGGAFVAVADDASAAYWNPAGFAAGSYFSLVLDRATAKLNASGEPAGSRSGLLIALGAPPIGLSYYRLRNTDLVPGPLPAAADNEPRAGEVRLDTLITHHTGATVLQSIAPGIAVGATLKLVRGSAFSVVQPDGDRDALLEDGGDLVGKASTKFDTDVGVMASAGRIKAGLTVRNVTEPNFETAARDSVLKLERQARAGIAVMPIAGLLVAADLDLTRTAGPLGAVRNLAAGAEARVARKHYVRGGVRLNTAGERATAVTVGVSYAATSALLVETQITGGSVRAPRGWGISARLGY